MEDQVGKSIIVFDANGNGIYSIDWPFDQMHLDHLTDTGEKFAILDKELPNLYWMDLSSKANEVLFREIAQDITADKTKAKADGLDPITISGLPIPCILHINGVPTKVDDGEFELTSNTGDMASITLGGPHRSNVIMVEFIDLDALKASKWVEIKQEREKRLQTAETSFGVFDADLDSKIAINRIVSDAVVAKSLKLPTSPIRYRMHDDTFRIFTPDEFMQASLEISPYLENVMKRSWDLKDHLDDLTSIKDIEDVNWDTKLP